MLLYAHPALDEEIGKTYRIPDDFTWTSGTDATTYNLMLTPFVMYELSGVVTDGEQPVGDALITATQ